MASYNLNSIPRINELLSNSEQRDDIAKSLNLKLKTWKFGGVNYHILKYDKEWLARENENTIGLLRSVIFKDDGTIVCFAPPKSQNNENIKITSEDQYVSEQFIEGTMINMFYEKENDSWQIATRTSVGGVLNFYMENGFKSEDTFSSMFEEIVNELCPNLRDKLNKNYMYSFVIQHPNNRIVKPVVEKRLYLVEIYKIEGLAVTIKNDNMDELVKDLPNIRVPRRIVVKSETELNECKETCASMNTKYKTVGVIIKDKHGNRYKFRNPNYEHVRRLRGNQPKLQYQYLALRQEGKIGEYLKYYPEQKRVFNEYRNLMHDYTNQLFVNYFKCYVKKEGELKTFPENYRTHMYKLHHEHYIPELMPKKEGINKTFVINYFNAIHPAKQMFVLNYSKRKQTIQEMNPSRQMPELDREERMREIAEDRCKYANK
uniref:T4 RNA ligase 1-like N-terminal domain-containing protein n=1 Tax=viral metagenome TaxID=1070528 RepID=A0A6C0CII5_9ZZZZ